MHWTYKDPTDAELEQGDIIFPSDYFKRDVLAKYHPYYGTHPHNDLYIVLTQSCDLVRRDGPCKSPYITLAPIRPLRTIIEREFNHQLKNLKPNGQPYGSTWVKDSFADFLTKLFNNNDSQYFYLKQQQDKQIAEDMCAVVALAISIKTVHYDECLKARVLQLDDTFQAKLGWLVGQRFSRVGTKDWPIEELEKRVNEVISNTAVWIDDEKVGKVSKEISKLEAQDPSTVIDGRQLQTILNSLPAKKEEAISAVFEVFIREGLLTADRDTRKFELRKKLRSDAEFSKFFSS